MDRIRVYTGGIAAANGYLIKVADNTYIAIDAPEGFADWIYSKRPQAKITDLLLTHQHFDHIQDAARIKERFNCQIRAHSAYDENLTLERYARESWNMDLHIPHFEVDDLLTSDEHTGNWGGLHWMIHHIPGHSPDSIVYSLPDESLLFSGDVLFAGSIGRTDLPGGNLKLLQKGIEHKILNQAATTSIFPGHGPYTTVRNEILTNPFLS